MLIHYRYQNRMLIISIGESAFHNSHLVYNGAEAIQTAPYMMNILNYMEQENLMTYWWTVFQVWLNCLCIIQI